MEKLSVGVDEHGEFWKEDIKPAAECQHDPEGAGTTNECDTSAISKWEGGNSLPDISVLPLLANALHCDIDSLLGYAAEQQKITDYEERYKADGYYWGIQPSNFECVENNL